jgi:hypothetical protein
MLPLSTPGHRRHGQGARRAESRSGSKWQVPVDVKAGLKARIVQVAAQVLEEQS